MSCQPEQPPTLDLIMVTYSMSPALAELFRDAKNNAYGIGCHGYPGARNDCAMWGLLCMLLYVLQESCQLFFPSTSWKIAICAASFIPFW